MCSVKHHLSSCQHGNQVSAFFFFLPFNFYSWSDLNYDFRLFPQAGRERVLKR